MRTRGRRKGSKPRNKKPTRKRGRKTRTIRGGVDKRNKNSNGRDLHTRSKKMKPGNFNFPVNSSQVSWGEQEVFGETPKEDNQEFVPGSGGGYVSSPSPSKMAWPNLPSNDGYHSAQHRSISGMAEEVESPYYSVKTDEGSSGEETEPWQDESNGSDNNSLGNEASDLDDELEPYVFSEVLAPSSMSLQGWTNMKASVQMMGIPDQDFEFLKNSYGTYLSLSSKNPQLLAWFRGYIEEFFIGAGKIPSTDYNGLAILFKDFATKVGSLRYMTESFKAIYELCFIHMPRLYRFTPAQSLGMFKTMLYHFFCQGIDFDRGIDHILQNMERNGHSSTATRLILHRGVRKGNALFVSSHDVGQTITFPTAISGTIYPGATAQFTDTVPNKKVVILYFGEARRGKGLARGPQLIHGMMVSASSEEPMGDIPRSEWEILLQSGLQGVVTEIEEREHQGTYYHIDVTGWVRVTDPRLVSQNIENITLEDIGRLTSDYTPTGDLPEESPIQHSQRFLSVHVPHGPIRHVMDHVIRLVKNKRPVVFSKIFRRLFRQLTIHKHSPLGGNTPGYSPNVPSGEGTSSGPGSDPFNERNLKVENF